VRAERVARARAHITAAPRDEGDEGGGAHPLMTSPFPSEKVNFLAASNCTPVLASVPTYATVTVSPGAAPSPSPTFSSITYRQQHAPL